MTYANSDRQGIIGPKGHKGLMGKPGLREETFKQKIRRIIYNFLYSTIYYKFQLHRKFKFLEKWY